jgi:hypothetical protein
MRCFLGLYHKNELKQVQVAVKGNELKGPGSIKINEVEFAAGYVKPMVSQWLDSHTKPLDLPGPGVRYFLITADIPKDARPGTYQSHVDISISGKIHTSVPLKLRVQDMELPVLRDLYVGMIFQSKPRFEESGLREYAKSGFSEVTIFGSFFRYEKGENGDWQVDLKDLEKKMELALKYGITAGICPFSDLDLGPLWGGGTLWKKTKSKEKWQAQVKRVDEFIKKHPEWPQIIWMTWDEPGGGKHGGPNPKMGWVNEVIPDAWSTVDVQLEQLKACLKWYTVPALDNPARFCGPELYNHILKDMKKNFGFCASRMRGEAVRYQQGMMMIASGAIFKHTWHICDTDKTAFFKCVRKGKGKNKKYFYFRSINMIGAGEGMDDLKIHRLLKNAMAEAEKTGNAEQKKAVKEAQAYLDRIHIIWDADHTRYDSLPYLGLAESWGYDRFYDDWQEQMARYAVKIKGVRWVK